MVDRLQFDSSPAPCFKSAIATEEFFWCSSYFVSCFSNDGEVLVLGLSDGARLGLPDESDSSDAVLLVPIVDRENLSVKGRLRIALCWASIEVLAAKTLPFLVGEWLQPLEQSALGHSELPYPLNVMDNGQYVVVVNYGCKC